MIRADASARIGHGHVARCLALADTLRAHGAHVSFISRVCPGDLIAAVSARGLHVHRLAGPDTNDADVGATLEALAGAERPDWLIVDHYEIGEDWERAVRPAVRRIMVIDDLANRTHDCDLLLDQNLVANYTTRYDRLIAEGTARALGPRYALLQPEYAALRETVAPRRGAVRRLLVAFGGGDAENLAARALAAFLGLHRDDVLVDVVAPAANVVTIAALARSKANIRVHGSVPSLAPLIAQADLAIGASGVTSLERMCLGLPAIVVTVADNQRPVAEELHRRGLVRWIGDQHDATEMVMCEAFREGLASEADAAPSLEAMRLVDGRGAERVTAALLTTPQAPLDVRAMGSQDEDILLEWANDPQTRRNAFSPEPISAETHHRWLAARLAEGTTCRFFMVESIGVPVGQARFQQLSTDTWEVHYGLAPLFRGRGLGRPLLDAALRHFAAVVQGASVLGRVKPENAASRRIFQSLGFDERASDDPRVVEYRRAT